MLRTKYFYNQVLTCKHVYIIHPEFKINKYKDYIGLTYIQLKDK